MEQRRMGIGFAHKNRFWITCTIVVLAMGVTWVFVTRDFNSQRISNIARINDSILAHRVIMETKADLSSVSHLDKSVTQPNVHPNKSTQTGMQQELATVTRTVLEAWRDRYIGQQASMVWPKELEESFVKEFQKWHVPETFPQDESGDHLLALLKIYHHQIPTVMQRICTIVDTRWKHAPSNDSGSNAILTDQDCVVHWDSQNQELWNEKLTRFRFRDDHRLKSHVPSPSQVFMLQQDLWLLESMFNIIRNVNGTVDANDLATIQKIDHVVFGREAYANLGELAEPRPFSDSETATNSGVQANRNTAIDRINRRAAANQRNSDFVDLDLIDYKDQPAFHVRYVDTEFEPIPAEEVRNVLTGEQIPADHLELIVSKRVPARLAVEMDEREIQKFLVECARSKLAFEVSQIRIRCHAPGDGIKLKGLQKGRSSSTKVNGREQNAPESNVNGAATPGLDDGADPGVTDRGKSSGNGFAVTSGGIETREDYIVGVEFYGFIKIYNPVNESLLASIGASTVEN